jgi:exopolysaccharide production protein ExoZ
MQTYRWQHLDQLRGLAAVAVMLFHIDKWNKGYWDPNTFLGRMGVSAVSIFFLLSGLTLARVYRGQLTTLSDFKNYTVRRAFRIYPLFIVATLATCILDEWKYSPLDVILNFTGLFGLVTPGSDIALGGWSIGVELVCYLLFPIAAWCVYQNSKWPFWTIASISVLLGFLFVFLFLSVDKTFESQYAIYAHWANHFYFFLGGIVISWLCDQRKEKKLILMYQSPASSNFWHFVLAGALGWLVFWPVNAFGGAPENGGAALIAGFNRIGLACASMIIVSAWHYGNIKTPFRFISWLGTISYSVYLLHPLVYRCCKALVLRFSTLYENQYFSLSLGATTIIGTLLVSWLTYTWLEKPFMKWGKRLTSPKPS